MTQQQQQLVTDARAEAESEGFAPLEYAAREGNLDAIRALLLAGEPLSAAYSDGTALHVAAQFWPAHTAKDMIAALLHGADVTAAARLLLSTDCKGRQLFTSLPATITAEQRMRCWCQQDISASPTCCVQQQTTRAAQRCTIPQCTTSQKLLRRCSWRAVSTCGSCKRDLARRRCSMPQSAAAQGPRRCWRRISMCCLQDSIGIFTLACQPMLRPTAGPPSSPAGAECGMLLLEVLARATASVGPALLL